ncbi:MAG: serine hydrolase domain-containing protein [Promethearchaeota archaeon]
MRSLTKNQRVLAIPIILMMVTVGIGLGFRFTEGPFKPSPIPEDDYSYVQKLADFKIKQLMRQSDIPGVAISLLDDQDIIMEEYYGLANVAENIPFSNLTNLKIGSITKLFTAIEVMRLVEDGLVDLDHPLTEYLPEFQLNYRFNSTPITIRQLLSHRSGLPRDDILVSWYWDNNLDCLGDQMRSLKDTYAAYPAGTRFKYSNVGFNILAHLIETKRGQPYLFYMEEKIFQKIGMNNTHYLTSFLANRTSLALGYYQDGNEIGPYSDFDLIEMGSGGLISQMGDLQIFFRSLVTEFLPEDPLLSSTILSSSILSSSALNSMYEPQFYSNEDPQEIGLGFTINTQVLSKKVVFHAGVNQGRHSLFAYIPETKQGVILFGNHDDFEEFAKTIVFDLLGLMLETKTGIKSPESNDVETYEMSQQEMEKFEGFYAVNGEVAEIFLDRSNVKISYAGQTMKLTPINKSAFRLQHWLLRDLDYRISFVQGGTFEGESDMIMIVSIGNAHNEFCPQIYQLPEFTLSGNYILSPRVDSIYTESDDFGTAIIEQRDGFCFLPLFNAVLIPINDEEILLVGGMWDGETLFMKNGGDLLIFQHLIFQRR